MDKKLLSIFHSKLLLKALLLSLFCSLPIELAYAQNKQSQEQKSLFTIKGRVLDEHNEALIGATVQDLSSKKGVMTDVDGYFNLKGVKMGARIRVSYLGMQSKTVRITKAKQLTIILKEDKHILSEVVVTGYQEVKKEHMTGSVATIKASEIKNLNIKSIDQVLKGNVSGLYAISSGRPGEDARISIRGANSLTGSTAPIWIIDGMPLQGEAPSISAGTNIDDMLKTSGIGNISPEDIESITVLKDAAASAIYGARAANGVIVVKTKTGKEGQTRYNFTAHFGLTERPYNNVRMMNAAEKVRFEREIYADMGEEYTGRVGQLLAAADRGALSTEEAEKQINLLANGGSTDWFKELYRPAYSQQVNASISGGSKKMQYYTSVNFLNEDGSERNNNYKRLRISTKLNNRLTDNMRLSTNLSATFRSDKRSASAISSLHYALYANPYEKSEGYDKSYDLRLSRLHSGLRFDELNVINELERNTSSNNYIEAMLNSKFEWDLPFISGLTYTAHGIIAYSVNNSRTEIAEGSYTGFVGNWLKFAYDEIAQDKNKGSLKEGSFQSMSYTFRNTLNYHKELAETHYIDLFAGFELSDRVMYSFNNFAPQFDKKHRLVGYPKMPEGVDLKKINFSALGGTARFQSKLASLFFNASYAYKDRYVLSGSLRYDGSDIIGNNNQFTPLWNASAKWNIHKEGFMEKANFVNYLALRAGFGYTGSIDKNALPFVVSRFIHNISYDGRVVPEAFNYANPDIKWQTKKDFNIGLESSFFNDRLQVNVNYYNNFVFDLLDARSRPYSSGVNHITQNVANLSNKGWEFDLGVTLVRLNKFSWNVRANLALNKNTVEKTYYKSLSELPEKSSGGNSDFVEGYPVGAWFGHRFAKVDPTTGHALAYGKDDKLVDMDLLGNVTLDLKAPELTYLGEFNPPILGGFSTGITWNRFIFNVNFEYQMGHIIRSFNAFRTIDSKNRYIADQYRWRSPGDIAPFPPIGLSSNAYSKYTYDVNLEKGDFLRCSYITMGYNLPNNWIKPIGLTNARISLTANNLFTITPYKGIDPSLMGSSMGYPNTSRYNLSFNIGF